MIVCLDHVDRFDARGVHGRHALLEVENARRFRLRILDALASRDTLEQTRYKGTSPRQVELKGLSQPVEVVNVEWQ